MVDLEWLGSLWTGFAARTGGFRYVLCFSSLVIIITRKCWWTLIGRWGMWGVLDILGLGCGASWLGWVDLSELIVSSFVGYFNLN